MSTQRCAGIICQKLGTIRGVLSCHTLIVKLAWRGGADAPPRPAPAPHQSPQGNCELDPKFGTTTTSGRLAVQPYRLPAHMLFFPSRSPSVSLSSHRAPLPQSPPPTFRCLLELNPRPRRGSSWPPASPSPSPPFNSPASPHIPTPGTASAARSRRRPRAASSNPRRSARLPSSPGNDGARAVARP